MADRSTIAGYWRCHGNNKVTVTDETGEPRKSTPSVALSCISITGIDATLAGTDILTGYVLPPSTIPLRYDIVSESTGGTGPLVDVGVRIWSGGSYLSITNGLIDGAPVDASYSYELGDIGTATAASLGNVYADAVTLITVSDGGGTNATGGTFDLHIWCAQDDARGVGFTNQKGIALPSTTDNYLRNLGDVEGYASWKSWDDGSQPLVPGVVPCVMMIRGLDATLAGTDITTGYHLPLNANVMRVDIRGQGTGGTAPLVDVGLNTVTEPGSPFVELSEALVDGAPVDSNSSVEFGAATAGLYIGIPKNPDGTGGFEGQGYSLLEVTVSDGGGTNATGGTFDVYIWYTFADDETLNN